MLASKVLSWEITSALDYIECDNLMITTDLTDGFWHIPIHLDDQQYLGIRWEGVYYVLTKPTIWNELQSIFFSQGSLVCCTAHMCTYYTFDGIHRWFFVDVVTRTYWSTQEHADQTLYQLGFVINWNQSCIDPQTSVTYIRHILSSHGPEWVPEIRVIKVTVRKLWEDIRTTLQLGALLWEWWQE